MAEAEDDKAPRYWVKNEIGRVWGPFAPEAFTRINLGSTRTRIMASLDGQVFAPIGHFPELLEVVRQARAAARLRDVDAAPEPETEPESAPTATPEPTPAPAAAPAWPRPAWEPRAPVHAPAPPQPEERGPASTGELSARNPVRLYSLTASFGLTGRLALESPGGTWTVHFKKGVPEHVDCPRPGQELARFLAARRVAGGRDLEQALELSGGPEGDLADALFALNVLPPNEIFRLLGEHRRIQLEKALGLEEGTFRWDFGVAPPPGSFPLGEKWTLLFDAVRRWTTVEVRRRLGTRAPCAIYSTSGAFMKLEELPLNAQETRVALQFDGSRSPDQIAAGMPGEGDVVHRTALLLLDVGFVTSGPELESPFRRPADDSTAPPEEQDAGGTDLTPPAEPTPEPLEPPPEPVAPSPADDAALREARELAAAWAEATHYQVLGVAENASIGQIKAAYISLARVHHPDTVPAEAHPALHAVKAELTARVNDAYNVLGDDDMRAVYVQQLQGGANVVDVGPLLEAENDFLKATLLVKSRRHAEALPLLERAVAFNPNEAEFLCWLAWTRFLVAEDKDAQAQESREDCTRATELDARCVPAHLFLGNLCRHLGDLDCARAEYEAVLALQPDNADAMRELRLLRSRR